jgi:bifunctional non-homologous end joining protein LigD
MSEITTTIEGKEIIISHPSKLIWEQYGITKLDYIQYLIQVSPYFLPYTTDRMLMIWRYPQGIASKKIEVRSVHSSPPEWLPRILYNGKERILLNNTPTLVWVANVGALELHVPFDHYYRKDYPTELIFDLDPPDDAHFELVLEIALKLKQVLDSLGLFSVPKTSGATGLQIYLPIEPKYTFEETRKINKFVAQYMAQQNPKQITLERMEHKRESKLYFDYLQLWRGRTMAVPYSVRARKVPSVSTPVTWEEVAKGFEPTHFTLLNVVERIKQKGDLFAPLSTEKDKNNQNLDQIFSFINRGV